MGQVIFFALFFITLLAGLVSYFAPHKPLHPLRFMMDKSGYSSMESVNRKKTKQLNMTTSRGLMQVRRQMENLAQEQNKFLETIQDQQRALKDAGREAGELMLQAREKGEASDKDVLRLQALAEQIQDEQRLLVAHGQDLILYNDQITKSRQWIADQIDLGSLNTETSLNSLQQQYEQLKEQSAQFFDRVAQHNQEAREVMNKMQEHLADLFNNTAYSSAVQKQTIKDRIQHMMEKERDDMLKVADSEERNRRIVQDARQNLLDSQEQEYDTLQETQDSIQQERQKEEDQQWISQQRIADQEQRMQDSQSQRYP